MPDSYNKLIEAYEELVKENTFLKAKARYFKQTALAQDVTIGLARKQIMELKAEAKELASQRHKYTAIHLYHLTQ